jgi:hypothetical protein
MGLLHDEKFQIYVPRWNSILRIPLEFYANFRGIPKNSKIDRAVIPTIISSLLDFSRKKLAGK